MPPRVVVHRLPDDLDHPCGRPVREHHPIFQEYRDREIAEYGPPEADGSWYECVTFGQPRRHHFPIPLDEVYEVTVVDRPRLRVVG